MSNKPDVLSEKQIVEWREKNFGGRDINIPASDRKAQRDADVEWFNSEYPIKYREEADEGGFWGQVWEFIKAIFTMVD